MTRNGRKGRRVAVLGAGIMGSSLALFLARRGVEVTLIDAAPAPFSGASRWNEGKIHLGFLYSADPSKATAAKLLPGGLRFKETTEKLIGCALDKCIAPADETYLVHADSVVPPDLIGQYFRDVADLAKSHPDAAGYVANLSRSNVHRLRRSEIEAIADPERIVAGFRVPERSINTNWLADRFVDSLAVEQKITAVMSTRVHAVRPAGPAPEDGCQVVATPALDARFDVVINALWHGRLAVDAALGLRPEPEWSHRFRLSLFIRTARPVDAPSVVLATGPFGDLKNYDGRNFYLSWYDAGLIAVGHGLEPPALPHLNPDMRRRTVEAIIDRLAEHIPAARNITANSEEVRLEGGWVFAAGSGSLADRAATVHRRDRFGVRRFGSYISVDTGKYSTAPWIAEALADDIVSMFE